MAELIFLGTSNAIASEAHENAHLAVVAGKRLALVDCPGNPLVRLEKAGLDPMDLTDLVLTHFHPDHVAGAPTLLMSSWLLGRTAPLSIYGPQDTLSRLQKMMDLYQWQSWPGFFPVSLHPLPEQEAALVLEDSRLRILASPVRHLIPAIGLRMEFPASGSAIAYSGDTAPCDEVIRLAHAADILIHEATGAHHGHTSAAQAGEVASRAKVRQLYLIHYRVSGEWDLDALVQEAEQTYPGPVRLANDFMRLEI